MDTAGIVGSTSTSFMCLTSFAGCSAPRPYDDRETPAREFRQQG
jgi:hypothetical protein